MLRFLIGAAIILVIASCLVVACEIVEIPVYWSWIPGGIFGWYMEDILDFLGVPK